MASRPLSAGTFLSILIFGLLFSQSSLADKKKPPERPVNLNTANSEQLQQVPEIGPATAGKILQMRKTYGPFKSVDDLLAIRGAWREAPRKDAQVFDRRETACVKVHAATGEVPSCCRKAIRQSVRACCFTEPDG
jgi:hypothetical protein